MFCLFGSSECANLLGSAEDETMHSCETPPAPPATGPNLLLQLGRLIIRARSASPASRAPRDRLLHAKLLAAKPSTSQQVQAQPRPSEEPRPAVEASLNHHVNALWNEQIPICIEVLLAPDCADCYQALSRVEEDSSFDRQLAQPRALLLERWSMRALVSKPHESPSFITSQWLLNAVRSQLHFSQLSAWLARLKGSVNEEPGERRRKLSREKCNYKKLESNCDEEMEELRKLKIVYSIKIPGESYKMTEFSKPPTDHTFPITDIGNNVYLKVTLESLPRIDEVPTVKCTCPPKRRASKEVPVPLHEELVGKLNDLTLGPRGPKFSPDLDVINSNTGSSNRRLSIISTSASTEYLYTIAPEKKLVDDRMHTPCSENGKHKCECDESDGNHRSSTSLSQETKKLDERRLKEIAKYKRRLRKESKLKKLSDSTSSEGDGLGSHKLKETHTSIPILQAARFDRFRAIGCYRNQTYLTLPASRMETKSPFVETDSMPPAEFKKTNTVATQTDEVTCACGSPLVDKCEACIDRGMVRSEANYNLASVDQSEVLLDAINRCKENGARRKDDNDNKTLKKHKCDNYNIKCDINSLDDSCSFNRANTCPDDETVVKRPKLRRFFPIVDKIEKIVSDRANLDNRDIDELHLKDDDSVFSRPKETKRQKTFSINDDDYVCFEKCDYGTIDSCEMGSPSSDNGFAYPDPKKVCPDTQVPSPTEMDRFRWRFDSAASMVFHTKTGLPLTSSPAPLRRGNNCFDFDDSINGISGIKSALFHPISPLSPRAPSPPPAPAPPPPPPRREARTPRLNMGPSAGLLGSFEESALKGRLEPVATVHGFTAELGASGAFCPPHKRLPVTVFFYAPGGTNAPYMGHINLGPSGYRVARSGTIQVSLFNPHGTLVKMFVVLYDLTTMPPMARTFLRQRTLYMPAGAAAPAPHHVHKWLRYLIHLRFMTSKSGKLYLHTDIRILVSRKADLDTATAHTAIFRSQVSTNQKAEPDKPQILTNGAPANATDRTPNRVFGGCSDFDSEIRNEIREIGYENHNGVSYELRSFTYAPENPKYSPR
ncbi:atos homolog atossa isoform X1 [Choristoneura fumiferana]|uniref:atos homolog atossa isoform X1 n=2 Tax=Choristoneura fumiferana TaxID=7141 RepID=UPI003D159CF9